MNSQDASVWWSAVLPQVVVDGSEGFEEWREYLLMWLSCPVTGRITQSASDGWAQASITRTSPYFWGGSVSQAKSDQQMQFPSATAI